MCLSYASPYQRIESAAIAFVTGAKDVGKGCDAAISMTMITVSLYEVTFSF